MVNCRECGASVSNIAKNCPHCGIGSPGRSKFEEIGCAAIVVAAILAVAMCSSRVKTSGADAGQSDTEWLAQHGDDPQALDHKFGDSAEAACSAGADDFLRSIAAYDFQWDSDVQGFMGIKFNKISTRSTGSGMLTLVSTRVKLSNAFGAFKHIDLFCLYDANRDKVVRFSQINPAIDASPSIELPPTIVVRPSLAAPLTSDKPEPVEQPSGDATGSADASQSPDSDRTIGE